MKDEYIPYYTKFETYAPFPPTQSKILQWLRPVLCLLRVHRPGMYALPVHEMTTDQAFRYSGIQIDEVEKAFKGADKDNDDFFQALRTGQRIGHDIDAAKPEKFVVATGLNDPVWFAALRSHDRRRLEEAIDTANPELKKKLVPVMEAVAAALLECSGLTSLIPSPVEAMDPPTPSPSA